jgi:hypothetical protein
VILLTGVKPQSPATVSDAGVLRAHATETTVVLMLTVSIINAALVANCSAFTRAKRSDVNPSNTYHAVQLDAG